MDHVVATCLALAISLAMTLSSQAQAAYPPADAKAGSTAHPATSPASAKLADWPRELSEIDWRQRQAATAELVGLGADADPLLRSLLGLDLNEETRKNVDLARQRIRDQILFGPSPITLHVNNAPAAEVFASIARQCSAPLPTMPEGLWKEPNWPKLTLDCDRKPFWQIMRDLGSRLGIDYLSSEPQEIRITRGSRRSSDGMAITGAFLFTVNSLVARNRMTIEMAVYGEPKIAVLRTIDLQVAKALDDQGKPLLPQTGRFGGRRGFGGGFGGFGRRNFNIGRQPYLIFQRPADGVAKIGRLQGNMTLVLQRESDTWEILDPLEMPPSTRVVDSFPVTLEGFNPGGGDTYELQISVPYAFMVVGVQEEVAELIRRNLRVLDAAGHALSSGAVDTRASNEGTEFLVDFARTTLPNGAKSGRPAKLIWEIPTATRNLVVPFDFKDVPINDPFGY